MVIKAKSEHEFPRILRHTYYVAHRSTLIHAVLIANHASRFLMNAKQFLGLSLVNKHAKRRTRVWPRIREERCGVTRHEIEEKGVRIEDERGYK